MRIVDRKTFLALPSGTIYALFEPNVFGHVQIKAQTIVNDFVRNDLIPMFEGWTGDISHHDVIEKMVEGESSPPFDYDSYGRDGLFDEDQLFAVFERRDVEALIDHLNDALQEGYAA